MKTFLPIFLALVFLLVSSCRNKDDTDVLSGIGILSWTGDYELDGCGYFIVIDNQQYKPDNEEILDDSYKSIVDLPVAIKYKLAGKITKSCFDSPVSNQYNAISIVSISKR